MKEKIGRTSMGWENLIGDTKQLTQGGKSQRCEEGVHNEFLNHKMKD